MADCVEDGADFEDFKDELLHKLNELRETNILCDTTIRAQGMDFPAHKCVLSAASTYFWALFTSEFKEKESNLVELQDAKSTTISDVLQFIYTGEISINSNNAQDLVMIADYLIIPRLKKKVSRFLEASLNASNCLALESFASQYNCESLKRAAVTLKFDNFVAVANSEDFRVLGEEKVKELICSDEINVSKEEEVYEAVLAWVKHDLPMRECLLPELLKCIRLFSVSKYSLRKILDEELVNKSLACTRVVQDAMDVFLFPDRFQDRSFKPRLSLNKYEQVVVLTGGRFESSNKKDTHCFVPSTRSWVSLPTMPSPRSCYGAAVCGGLLYVLGGIKSVPICCFNPKLNKWSCHGSKLNLKDCSVSSFHEELYVIGGEGSWRDVQIYNPILDKWRQGASMETGRAAHSAVLLQEHIYVIAGHDGTVCHNTVECYNPLTDQWSKVSNISKARRFAAAATAAEKIVLVGGFGDMTVTNIEPSCEIYEPSANQWSLVSSPGWPRAAHAAVSMDNKFVYIFGGENETTHENVVECFDITSNKWHKIDIKMPAAIQASYLQASLLKLPKEFIHK
ncbi:kelch-like protein 12 [Oculina patagonica]